MKQVLSLFTMLALAIAACADSPVPENEENEMEFTESEVDESKTSDELVLSEEEVAGVEDGMEFSEEQAAEMPEGSGYDFLDEIDREISWDVTYKEGIMFCPELIEIMPADTDTFTGLLFFSDDGQSLQIDGISEQGPIIIFQEFAGPGGAFYKGTQNFAGADVTTQLEIYGGMSTLYGSINSVENECRIQQPFELLPAEQ